MDALIKLSILVPLSYCAGSINFSIILFKFLGRNDPRSGFSGNAGTSNVYRQAGIFWAAVVLLLDVGRAVAIALLSTYILPGDLAPWPGLALIAGNRYPCFHGFRGGKGVANFLGFSAVITPLAAAISAAAWVLVYGITRITFIASFAMILILGAGTVIACDYKPAAITGTLLTVIFIMYNHKKNIVALREKKK